MKSTKALPPELEAAAELTAPVSPEEMIECLEEDAQSCIESNSTGGDVSTVEIGILRNVRVLREAANFIREHSQK